MYGWMFSGPSTSSKERGAEQLVGSMHLCYNERVSEMRAGRLGECVCSVFPARTVQ